MTFFNQKEEVLEVEVTLYGRYLLSLGEWKPVYYSFFDNDVAYDSKCIGFSEDQSLVETRIKETSRFHCQAVHRGIDENLSSVDKQDGVRLQGTFEREYALTSELGVADYYSDYAPAWDVNVLKGEITSSVTVHSSSGGDGPNYMIPQLNMKDLTYDKIAGALIQAGPNSQPDPLFDDDLRTVDIVDEGTFIEIRNDFLLLEIGEKNTTFQKENFEIELFEVDYLTPTNSELPWRDRAERLTPLKFAGPRRNQEMEYVDYYFNLDVDKEIDEHMLCKFKGVDSTKGLFLQGVFDCELADVPVAERPYATDVSDVGDACPDPEDV